MLTKTILSLGALAALAAVTPVLAQTKTILTSKTFTVGPAQAMSTYDFSPQIQPDPLYNPSMAAENDVVPWPKREPANSLRAGKLMVTSRGRAGIYFPGPVDGRWVPPDNQMAVGPDHIVCIINSTIAFYTKSGTKLFQQLIDGNSGFFQGTNQTTFVFDPKAFYDSISKRFFVLADDGADPSGNGVDIAVSDDSNPNGTWFKYHLNTVFNGSWLDYPGFGFNKDAIVVTGNLFNGAGSGVEALVIPKAPLLTGGSATVSVINDPTTFTLQPARTTDSTVDKVYGVATGGGNAMRLYAFTNLLGSPVLKEADVPVPAYTRPQRPANSGGHPIDSLDGRQMTCNFRNGQVVAAHTVSIGSALGVRWYDFNVNTWPTTGSPGLKQSGDITQPNVDIHMPGINMNGFEDITVFYSRSSATITADLCYSARTKNDPVGQIGQPVKLFGSGPAGYGGRWGDYFANEIDPNDDATFWGFGMGINGGSYTTQVLNWTVTAGSASGTPVPADSISTFVGTFLAGDTSSVATADGVNYLVGSAGVPLLGQAAGVEADFTVPNGTSNIAIDFATNGGIIGGTNMVWAFNNVTNKFDLIGSVPLVATGNAEKFLNIRATDMSRYIGAGGLVRVQIRGHLPIRPFNNSMPNPFTYSIDLLKLIVR